MKMNTPKFINNGHNCETFRKIRWMEICFDRNLLQEISRIMVVPESCMLFYCRYLVRSFRLILPFFPTATMERIDREGQIVTAKVDSISTFRLYSSVSRVSSVMIYVNSSQFCKANFILNRCYTKRNLQNLCLELWRTH